MWRVSGVGGGEDVMSDVTVLSGECDMEVMSANIKQMNREREWRHRILKICRKPETAHGTGNGGRSKQVGRPVGQFITVISIWGCLDYMSGSAAVNTWKL